MMEMCSSASRAGFIPIQTVLAPVNECNQRRFFLKANHLKELYISRLSKKVSCYDNRHKGFRPRYSLGVFFTLFFFLFLFLVFFKLWRVADPLVYCKD